MDKKKKVLIVAAVSVVLVLGYVVWADYLAPEDMTVQASGTIEATTVELTAKLAGTIQSIKVKAGEEVKQGDFIAELSRNDLVAQRERDALNILIAQNKLDDLLSGARIQEIREATAHVNICQATNDKTKKDLERAEALYQEGSIALAELEVYQNNYIVAVNQLEAAQAKLSLLQAGSRDEQVKAAENQVKMMEEVLKASDSVLADLRIIAPINGTIQGKNYEAGEFVPAGASLATLVDLQQVWINVYIPTDELPYVKLGEKAQFTISGLDRIFEGTIAEIASRGEFTPKTIQTKKERVNVVYKVRIEADNSEGFLKPGMPADVSIKKVGQGDRYPVPPADQEADNND